MGQNQQLTKPHCIEPIGRIISAGDRYLGSGSLLCPGDKIYPKEGATVELLCYSSKKYLELEQAGVFDVQNICKAVEVSSVRRCTPINRQSCPNRKGPGEDENTPRIIQPYGQILIDNRPLISWSAVQGATSYSVQVKNGDVRWEKEVKGTTLAYPEDKPELVYGTAIKIVVIANKGIDPISAETLVVHLLREKQIREINQAVEQIKKLGLPPDQAAYLDLDTIYMSKRILNTTIETLEARVAAGSLNPTVYRTLGDRYIEAWLPKKAKSAYTKALQLARFQKNSEEVVLAQERLRSLNQSQLPTRINPAQ
ncbi:hypothetical protein [Nostoc sp. TCL26-01]|uniref:hypothetical protein n=1 Tax=Nostoc sp. TCL26-01 TaxID=2576904 RepID=UPI002117BC46|nr:hypothetical protein [Nostoc sp. TCL26-01]